MQFRISSYLEERFSSVVFIDWILRISVHDSVWNYKDVAGMSSNLVIIPDILSFAEHQRQIL